MPQFDTSFLHSLVFWSAISFTCLLIILYKFGLPPILETLEARKRQIQEDLDRAERARSESEARLADYERQLKQAREEAMGIIEEARRQAQKQVEEAQRKAEQQTAAMLREAQEEMARERARLRDELRSETVALVMAVAERVLARRLTAEDDRRLIEEALSAAQTEWGRKG